MYRCAAALALSTNSPGWARTVRSFLVGVNLKSWIRRDDKSAYLVVKSSETQI